MSVPGEIEADAAQYENAKKENKPIPVVDYGMDRGQKQG